MTLDDSMIITAFGAMGAVITVMWNKLSAENRRLATHFDKCDEERKKLFEEVADLRGDRELLERCPAARCPIKPAGGAHLLAGLVVLAFPFLVLTGCTPYQEPWVPPPYDPNFVSSNNLHELHQPDPCSAACDCKKAP